MSKAASQSAHNKKAEEFISLACLCYGDPHYDHRSFHAQAHHLLRTQPRLSAGNIWAAAAAGDTAAIRASLEEDRDLLNRPGPHRWTPLFCACYSRVQPLDAAHSTFEAAKLLLERGANPNANVTKNYYTNLRFNVLTGVFGGGDTGMANQPAHPHWRELAELLLKHGANPMDATALRIMQTREITYRKLELLLKHGLKGELLGSTLARVIFTRDPKSVKLLLDHHAYTEELTDGKTPWQIAMERGDLESAALLQKAGARTFELQEIDQFVSSCMTGNEQQARSLLAQSPRLLRQAPKDMVHRAVNTGNQDAVKLVLELGFDPNFQDDSAALHTTGILAEHPEILRLLLDRGADLKLREPFYDSTAIGWADFFDQTALRDKLLDEPGICLFDALDYNRLDRVPSILSRDPDALERPFAKCLTREPKPDDWQTPLARMLSKGNQEAAALLRQHGAIEA